MTTLRSVETSENTRIPARSSVARRTRRTVGNVLLTLGLGVLLWTFIVWQWNDPFTSLYTRWQQHKLTAAHELIAEQYRPRRPIPVQATLQEEAAAIAKDARRLLVGAAHGAPIGRIIVPRLHLNMLMVNGTDSETLKLGPGRDERTYLPGQGQLIYIAGHRTTYLAPFSASPHRRCLRPLGAEVRDHEVVALQACHPRFFASHRYIVWAKPVLVRPIAGRPYRPVN